MGIFFIKEDKGKYFLIRRRKFALMISFLPVFLFFIVLPIVVFSFKNLKGGLILLSLIILMGLWIGIEGAYYHDFLLKKYKKQGKKIERAYNTKIGTKVYK